MRYLYTMLSIVLFIAVLGFAVKNGMPVTLYYYLGLSWSAPLALVVFASFGCGVACAIIASIGLVVKERRTASALQRELASLNQEPH
jgi:lipopolysaccharide assembly protein A